MKRSLLPVLFSFISVWSFAGTGPSSDAPEGKNALLPPPIVTGVVYQDTCNFGVGSIDLTVTGGVAPYTYQWSNGANTEDISNLLGGNTYAVTVTDAMGNTAVASFMVNDFNVLFGDGLWELFDYTLIKSSCLAPTGAFIFTNNSPYNFNYLWDTGETTPAIYNVDHFTNHYLTISLGTCTVDFVAFGTPDQPWISEVIAPASCGDNGSIDITIDSGSVAPFTYIWSNGATSEDLDNLVPGIYDVTVTGSNGCGTVRHFEVLEMPQFDVSAIVSPQTSCLPDNGAINLTISPPNGNYSFNWGNTSGSYSANTEDVINLIADTYFITVTDNFGCTYSNSFVLTNNSQILLSENITNATCGQNNGAVNLMVNGGPASYSWSNASGSFSANTEDIFDVPSGTYFVTVTGSSGCEGIDTVIILDQVANPTINANTVQNSACMGGNGSITTFLTPTGIYNYAWSNGENTPSIINLAGGTYTVSVSAGNCITSASFNITNSPNLISLNVAATAANCGEANGAVNLTVNGVPPFTYEWSNGSTSEDIMGISPGTYTVTVAGEGGCSEIATAIVLNNGGGSDTTNVSETTCDPNGVGTFVHHLTGEEGCDSVVINTVSLSAVDTTAIFNTSCDINDVGVFEQTLVNSNGCDSLIITTIAYAAADTTNISGTSCDINEVGVFEQTLTNGNGCDSLIITTITYAAADTTLFFDTSCDIIDVGVFEETLTNGNGCDSLIITTITYASADTTLFFDTSCDIIDVGVFEETLTNGNGCDSLIITTITYAAADTTSIFNTSCDINDVGVFEQTLINSNGCDSLIITTITYAAADTTLFFDTSCDVNDVGVFQQTLTNGNGCDSIIITTITYAAADTTLFFNTSCDINDVGVFEQALVNQNGCDSLIITTITYSAADTTLFFDTSCDINAVGVFEQTFINNNGCDSLIITTITYAAADTTKINGTSCDINDVGVFEQTMINSNGCDSLIITTIIYSAADTTHISGTSCDINDVGVFEQTLVNSNGCDSLIITTVTLLPSVSTDLSATTCNPTQAGVFIQNLTTWQGCDSTVTTTVTLLPSATTSLSATTCDPTQAGTFIQNLSTWQGCDSIVTTTVALLPDATTSIASTTCDPTQAGVFTQNLTTWQGCDSTVTTTVTLTPPPMLTVASSDHNGFGISCNGTADGWAHASATGVPPFQFVWANGMQTPLLEGLAPGVYAVSVTDGNGCTSEGSVEITGPGPLANALSITAVNCFDAGSGGIMAMGMGGVPPYQFSLAPVGLNNAPFQASGSFGGLGAGAYEITVLDANGCTATDLVAVNAPVPLDVKLGDDVFLELGDGTALSALVNVPLDSLTGVNWSPNVVNLECPQCPFQQVFPVVTTAYTVTVTDAQGCVDSDGVSVYVDRTKNIYVPNAFSPDGDGINDLLLVFAKPGQVKKVRSFLVFDRWGESVFRYFDFQPNDPAAGWDGSHRGQPLNPAVFVWFAEVEFVDGEVALFEGDVVLVR